MPRPSLKPWFENAGGWRPAHDVGVLRSGLAAGLRDEQDEYGYTALILAVTSDWLEGVEELVRAGANTELRDLRTGATALYDAAQPGKRELVAALLAGGANPDAANHYGVTPRQWRPEWFADVPPRPVDRPPPLIQNAEHLADHYHPRFKIPEREERETLKSGQAVEFRVFGPKADGKDDRVKVRITARRGRRPKVVYTATVETPIEQTFLPPGTATVEFGPEHVATVYVPRPAKKPRPKRK